MMRLKNYINGVWINSTSQSQLEKRNPANTDEILGIISFSTPEEVQSSVIAAQEAFKDWSRKPIPQRGQILFNTIRIMERRKGELSEIITREEGKTIKESLAEVQRTIDILEFIIGESTRFGGQVIPSRYEDRFCFTIKQPLGVVAVITPWNFPLAIPAWKIIPAILAGNSVVFKPSPVTPFTAVKFIEILKEAGIPNGVVNLIFGGEVTGQELVSNCGIKAISFTGSNKTGFSICQQASEHFIKGQYEMGGKNGAIVLEDADIDWAAKCILHGAFGSTGQRCSATSRVVIIESIADEFICQLLKLLESIKIGNGLNDNVNMGPVSSEEQLIRVMKYIEIGCSYGAKKIAGGNRVQEGELSKGFFIEPTIFDYVENSHPIAQEEIFGPVLSIIRVNDFEKAIEIINSTKFGLSSAIFSKSLKKIFHFLNNSSTGVIHINSSTEGSEPQHPFGGFKNSGYGQKELGREAIDFYCETKLIYLDYNK